MHNAYAVGSKQVSIIKKFTKFFVFVCKHNYFRIRRVYRMKLIFVQKTHNAVSSL